MHTIYVDTADTIWLDRATEHWYSDILINDSGAGVTYVSFYVWKTTITENSILAWQVPYESRFAIDISDRTKRVKADLPLELVIRR